MERSANRTEVHHPQNATAPRRRSWRLARAGIAVLAVGAVATLTLFSFVTFGEDPFPPIPERDDPNWRIGRLADRMAGIEDELVAGGGAGLSCGQTQAGPPTFIQGEPDYQTTSTLRMTVLVWEWPNDPYYVTWTGSLEVTAHQSDGTMELVAVLGDGGQTTRTLMQSVWLEGDVVHWWGTLDIVDSIYGSASFAGGWTYVQGVGIEEDPDSEPGFHDEVNTMFGCESEGFSAADGGEQVSTAGFGIGAALAMVGNVASMVMNYIADLFIPYVAPEEDNCDGPEILDGPGESCEGVDIPCDSEMSRMCGKIDDLTLVSEQFKQCMGGRCGCGESRHRRARMRCDDASDCGPCGAFGSADGCSLGGTTLWYCDGTSDECPCIGTAFHEMSHACGAMDFRNGTVLDSYRIGDWFAAACDAANASASNTPEVSD